jgi:hypothetical protein
MSTKADNLWADKEIERWQMKTLGVNPMKHYISIVVSNILNNIPDGVIKYSGVDYHIVEDIITQEPDDFMKKNVYDLYNEHIDEDTAAEIFGKVLEEYMMGG